MNKYLILIFLSLYMGNWSLLKAQYEGSAPYCHQGGGLMINEISNGPPTIQNNAEYVELIVLPDPLNPAAPVNLENWILDDNNIGASGQGNAIGHFVLGDCYQAVPPGSILVIINPDDRNPDLPDDDPIDADQDGVYIIRPDNGCVTVCNSNPSFGDSSYCPCTDPAAPSSGWQIGLRNEGDLFQVRDGCGTVVQAISWGDPQLAAEVSSSPAYFRLNGDNQSNLVIRFTHSIDNNWNNPANYDNPSVDTGQSPGAPNNTANADFIQQLKSGVINDCTGAIYDCRVTDAGDLVPPAGVTTAAIVLCQGEDLGPFSVSYDQADEDAPQAPGFPFEYAFLLTGDDAPDYTLLSYTEDGDFDFSSLPLGNYRLWGFSYIQAGGSVPVGNFLSNSVHSIADIQAYFSCGYDGDLDSLDQNGQVVEIQVTGAPAAVTPSGPLRACSNLSMPTFNLTTFDNRINAGTNFPVIWYSDSGATQAIADPSAYVAAPGQVYARLESGNCVSNTVTVELEIGADLGLALQVDRQPDCDNPLGEISLIANNTDELSINWNFDEWDGQRVLTGLTPGTYTVTVTNPGGCRDTASVRLNPSGTTIAEFLKTNPVCDGVANGAIELVDIVGGLLPYQVSLNGGDFEPADNWSASGLSAGVYTLILQDNSGCETAQNITLTETNMLSLDLGPDLELEEGDSAFISVSSNFQITSLGWTPQQGIHPASSGLTVIAGQTTTYSVTAQAANGCMAGDQLTVTVIPAVMPPVPEESKIFIPNAFSPNEDGVNDSFTIFAGAEVADIKSLRIFDRWGNLMYIGLNLTPNDLQQGWDGQYKGKPMTSGAYVYFLEVNYVDGTQEVISGEINLLR